MNSFLRSLMSSIKKISYCHFKSNNKLIEALSGVDDLDLLVSGRSR